MSLHQFLKLVCMATVQFYQALRISEVAALRKCNAGGVSGLIFKNPDGTFFSYHRIQAAYDRAFRESHLSHRGTHVLRHGGTRHVYNETGDLSIAQQLLGNLDFETTLVYARRHKGALTKLAESHWNRRSEGETNEVKMPQPDGVMKISHGL